MAVTGIRAVHIGGDRNFSTTIRRMVEYASDPEKTRGGKLVTGFGCVAQCAEETFTLTKWEYIKRTGKELGQRDIILYHMWQSFQPGEITPEEANRIGVEFTKKFTKGRHAFLVCTHTDRAHIHNHIVWNAVALDCRRKFHSWVGMNLEVRKVSDQICKEHGLSVLPASGQCQPRGERWRKEPGQVFHREALRSDIDIILRQRPANLGEILQRLEGKGYRIKYRNSAFWLKRPEWKRAVRIDSLGKHYTEAELRSALTAERNRPQRSVWTERDKTGSDNGRAVKDDVSPTQENETRVERGEEYLRRCGIESCDVLIRKMKDAAAECEERRKRVRTLENQMAELGELRTQMVRFRQTKSVYDAYRRSGCSGRFQRKHMEELLIHRAARTYFETLGLHRLPSIGDLQSEYIRLKEQRNRALEKYRAARKEVETLQSIRRKWDRYLRDKKREEYQSRAATSSRSSPATLERIKTVR